MEQSIEEGAELQLVHYRRKSGEGQTAAINYVLKYMMTLARGGWPVEHVYDESNDTQNLVFPARCEEVLGEALADGGFHKPVAIAEAKSLEFYDRWLYNINKKVGAQEKPKLLKDSVGEGLKQRINGSKGD